MSTKTKTPPGGRLPFEVADTLDCKVRDYVRFCAILETEEHDVVGRQGMSKRKLRIIKPISGSGQVLKIYDARSRAVPPRHYTKLTRDRELTTLSVATAKIDAGSKLGVVRALLHGAELDGVQLDMFGRAS